MLDDETSAWWDQPLCFDFSLNGAKLPEHDLQLLRKANLVVIRTRGELPPPAGPLAPLTAIGIVSGLVMLGLRTIEDFYEVRGTHTAHGILEVEPIHCHHAVYGAWRDDATTPAIQEFRIDPFPLNVERLHTAHSISRAIRSIEQENTADPHHFFRLGRGIAVWHSATREPDICERLHQFVRVIEALLPMKVRRAEEFARACVNIFKTMTSPHANGKRIDFLEYLYNVRSKIEHMVDIGDVVPNFASDTLSIELYKLSLYAELLASNALARVLTTPKLLDRYRTDEGIDRLFSSSESEQRAVWGEPFNVVEEVANRRGKIPCC